MDVIGKIAVTAAAATVLSVCAAPVAQAKGGPAAMCSTMRLRARMHSAACNHRIASAAAQTTCAKKAAAAGLLGGGYVAVTTSPLDWPGVATAATFWSGGTFIFCEIGWV